jgi:Na+-transporting methylmalonyl-CoA/oxaloacetate decarboxylase gamma subunit
MVLLVLSLLIAMKRIQSCGAESSASENRLEKVNVDVHQPAVNSCEKGEVRRNRRYGEKWR